MINKIKLSSPLKCAAVLNITVYTRRLANANRSRVSGIRCIRGRPCKNLPHFIIMQKLVVVSYTVCAHLGSRNFVDVGLANANRFWDRECGWPLETLLPTYVIIPNFVALGETIWVYVRRSPKMGDAGSRPFRRGWLTRRNTLVPHMCY